MSLQIHYKRGYKYQLACDYHHVLMHSTGIDVETDYLKCCGRRLSIRKGYASDGPSGPTLDTKTAMRGAYVHDALYQLMRMKLLPRTHQFLADDELEQCMIEDGAWRVRASLWERILNRFGGRNTDPANRKPVLVAP